MRENHSFADTTSTERPGPPPGAGLPPPAVLTDILLGGALLCRGVWLVAELGLAEHLASGPRTAAELAEATGTHADALHRVLRLLVHAGVLADAGGGRFAATEVSSLLRPDVPGSLHAWVRLAGADWNFERWTALLDSVKNGLTSYENRDGIRMFEWYDRHPARRAIFNDAMTSVSDMVNGPIVAAYDFSGIETLVDVAGGEGALLGAVLRANPRMKGTLFDQPGVIGRARQGGHLAAPDLAGRVELVAGSFFESVPKGHDAYTLKWILHDWRDHEAASILAVVRAAMTPGKRLLILEMVIQPGNAQALYMDLAMLTLTGGRERTADEYRALLASSGLALQRVIPTASPFSVIEAVAV